MGFLRLFQDLVELGAWGVQPLGSHRDVWGTDSRALRRQVGPMHVSSLLLEVFYCVRGQAQCIGQVCNALTHCGLELGRIDRGQFFTHLQ